MNINIHQYKIIPNWVFQFLADHFEFEQVYCPGRELDLNMTKDFFENSGKQVYILDEVRPNSVEEYNQQSYLADMAAIAAGFGATIIRLESEEAKTYFVEKKRQEAAKFNVAANPFSTWSVENNTLVIAGQS